MSDQDLIGRWIEQNPHRPGADEVRIVDYSVPVWALVAHWQAIDRDIGQVAADYALPLEAVAAALAYYRQHPDLIDARIAANEAAFAA